MADEAAVVTQTEEPPVSTPSSEPSPASDAGTAFDAAAFEADFGMPQGSLSGAADADAAKQIIADYTDKLLSAGIVAPERKTETPAKPTPAANPTAAPSGNAEIDALRAEFQEYKKSVEEERESYRLDVLDERIKKEIDRWDSPKYGKEGQRTFNQLRAEMKLRELVTIHANGHARSGKAMPGIEAILRQVRVFDDPDYKPSTTKNASQKPLGTPGTPKGDAGGDGPRNIHMAYGGSLK